MRIKRLVVPDFKNLKGLILEPHPEDMTTVVIGQNATGKSNLIEALVAIFRHLDLGEEPPKHLRNYEIEYICRGHRIQVKVIDGRVSVEVLDSGEKKPRKISLQKIAKESQKYLPTNVFVYYSGRNERLEELFLAHQGKQFRSYRGELKRTKAGDSQIVSEDVPLRRLFYCRNEHSQLILLAYLIELERNNKKSDDQTEPDILKEYLGIEGLESALFVLKKPHAEPTPTMLKMGDERFWHATGVLAEFLDILWRNALAPIDHDLEKFADFRGRKRAQKTRYLYLDRDRLIKAAEEVGDAMHIFRQLEGVYMADYLDEVRIQVQRTGIHEPLFFQELSEGEQQLMTVLGLIRFTRDDESLFLLDEPDTHLNPIWKYDYFGIIDDLLGKDPERRQKNQLFLATHDPLMLGSLRKQQVRVLREEKGICIAEEPIQDPRGMGFSGLLRSDMFGLQSTVDPRTLEDLDRRNELVAKQGLKTITPEEEQELGKLQKRLEELGFTRDYRDPLYQYFVERMAQIGKLPLSQVYSQEQLKEQEELAERIIKQVLHERQIDKLSDLAKELKLDLEKAE
jgi:predicted ATPase